MIGDVKIIAYLRIRSQKMIMHLLNEDAMHIRKVAK